MPVNRKLSGLHGVRIAAAIALAACCAGCARRDGAQSAAAPEVVPVRVIPATLGKIPRVIEVAATLVASKRAEISPQVEGVVAEVFKDLGDPVAKGEPLLRLDDEEYRLAVEQARAELARAEAAVAEARARLVQVRSDSARARELRRQGVLSAGQFETQEAALRVAEAAVQAAHAAREPG